MLTLPLEEMAPHIAYEAERMRFIAAPPDFMENSNRGGVMREAFLIHFRNLIDFLYAPRKFKTDAIAAHYLDNNSSWTPNVPAWWEEDKERCNKLLHHPTYERVEYEETGALKWKRNFRDQAAHLLTDWKAFLAALSSDRRAWFKTPRQKF